MDVIQDRRYTSGPHGDCTARLPVARECASHSPGGNNRASPFTALVPALNDSLLFTDLTVRVLGDDGGATGDGDVASKLCMDTVASSRI